MMGGGRGGNTQQRGRGGGRGGGGNNNGYNRKRQNHQSQTANKQPRFDDQSSPVNDRRHNGSNHNGAQNGWQSVQSRGGRNYSQVGASIRQQLLLFRPLRSTVLV